MLRAVNCVRKRHGCNLKKTNNKNRQKTKQNKEPGLSYPEGAQGKKEHMKKLEFQI